MDVMELAREGKGSEASEGCSEQRRDLLRHRGWPWMLLCVWTLKSTTYIHTVHIVYSLYLTICEIRRELTVRQQQMDDTVGGEGIWIGNVTAPGQRRARGFYPAPWCWAGLPTEGRWLHLVYMCSLPIRNFPSVCGTTSLKSNECMWYDDMLI